MKVIKRERKEKKVQKRRRQENKIRERRDCEKALAAESVGYYAKDSVSYVFVALTSTSMSQQEGYDTLLLPVQVAGID